MSNLLKYKGYYGTVEFSAIDNIFFGKVTGIRSLISYEGANIKNLKKNFKNTVNDYLEMCLKMNIEPEK